MSIFEYQFVKNALLVALFVSWASALIGPLVVTRRMVFLTGGIAHAAFGGIGLGVFLGVDPFKAALIFTTLSAFATGLSLNKLRVSEDSAIGILWALGMALGAMFIALKPGYRGDLMGYLFGNILMVTEGELWLIGALVIALSFISLGFWKEIIAVSFDPEFCPIVGINPRIYNTLFLVLTAVSCIVMMRAIGIILVIALLTIPVLVANHFTKDLKKLMLLSGIFGFCFITAGMAFSFVMNVPSGAITVIFAGSVFLALHVLESLFSPEERY